MTRFLALVGALFVAAPALAQTTEAPAADSVATDAVAVRVPDPSLARDLFRTGQEQARAGNHEAALATYDEALFHDPSFAGALAGRAQSLAQLGRLPEARSGFEAALAAATGPENAQVRTASQRAIEQITTAIEQRSSAAGAAATAQRQADQAREAVGLLQLEPVSESNATQAIGLLDNLRAEGFDTAPYAFQYARAYNVLGRGAEAVPYAQASVESAQGDRSAFYIQLGLAYRQAGNAAEARAAFESAKEGSWSGWAEHYLREMDAETGG